jgi:hypothetical protein
MDQRIIYPTDNGVAVVIPAPECGLTIEQIADKDVPAGKPRRIVDVSDLPLDRTFRNAWEYSEQGAVEANLDKAKLIAHDARRAARAKEFAPYDEVIMKQIPGNDAVAAETERQKVRDKYAVLQTQMDAAQTVEELKNLMPVA